MRVLTVDDDPISLRLLRNALEDSGYEVTQALDGKEALRLIRTEHFPLVISDWEMPKVNGLELCREIRKRRFGSYIYTILVTARTDTQDVIEGLNAGADDFLSKPFDPLELRVRLRTGERILSLDGRDIMIFSLAKLAESRDPETGAHLERVREYSRVIAQHLSKQEKFSSVIDADFIETIYLTTPLHDIGKVGIPDRILLKRGALTKDEFEVLKQHTIIGAETLDAAARMRPEAEFLRVARDIARSHHERFDGRGYPDGLAGEEIPLASRIVALADVYDALTTKRVYKEAFSHEEAKRIIVHDDHGQFDPDILEAFLANEERFIAIHDDYSDGDQFFDAVTPVLELAAAPT